MRNKNQKYVLAKMVSLGNKRREQRNGALHNSLRKPVSRNYIICEVKSLFKHQVSVLEAFVDNSPDEWSTREIIRHLNNMWTTLSIGVVSTTQISSFSQTDRKFQVATQFIQDLVQYKVYAPALIQDMKNSQASSLKSRGAQTSLLEGFLMESMRFYCFQSTAVHRIALKPFTFSGGFTVPAGESIQFYQEKNAF